jgi:hypothetical protein
MSPTRLQLNVGIARGSGFEHEEASILNQLDDLRFGRDFLLGSAYLRTCELATKQKKKKFRHHHPRHKDPNNNASRAD